MTFTSQVANAGGALLLLLLSTFKKQIGASYKTQDYFICFSYRFVFFFLSEPLYLLRYNKFWGGLTGQKTLIPHVSIFFSVTLQLHFGCFVKLTSVSEILYSHTCYLECISACKLIAMQSLYGSNAQYH